MILRLLKFVWRSPHRELAGLDAAEAERDRRVRALFVKWAEDPPARPWTEADMHDEDGVPR